MLIANIVEISNWDYWMPNVAIPPLDIHQKIPNSVKHILVIPTWDHLINNQPFLNDINLDCKTYNI